MKVIEIMKLGRKFFELLQKACIKLSDFEHIELYDEYTEMLGKGMKKCYIVAHLSEKYRISERKVWYVIKKFERDCNVCAAG